MVEDLKMTRDWSTHPDFNKAVEHYKKMFPGNEPKARQLAQISLFQKYEPDEYNKLVNEFIENVGEPTARELKRLKQIPSRSDIQIHIAKEKDIYDEDDEWNETGIKIKERLDKVKNLFRG